MDVKGGYLEDEKSDRVRTETVERGREDRDKSCEKRGRMVEVKRNRDGRGNGGFYTN